MSDQESSTPNETLPELEAAKQVIESVEQSLQAGRAPRGRKPLRDAIRIFRQHGRAAETFEGLRLLAELEYRQGCIEHALTAARSSQRVAEQHPGEPWLDASLELLARLYCETGEYEKAQDHVNQWLQRAQARGDQREVVDVLLLQSRISWRAGSAPAAIEAAEEAVTQAREQGDQAALGKAQLALGSVLLNNGCPWAAHYYFTELLRETTSQDLQVRFLLSRGAASLCLGNYNSAARDFGRALRKAKNHPDRRLEVESTAALAAAQAARGHEQQDRELLLRAEKLVSRATRRCRRLRDAQLVRMVDAAQAAASRGEAALTEAAALPSTPREAAGALVQLAKHTQSEVVVNACVREVEWLATLGQQAPPYRCNFEVPFLPRF